MSTTDQIVEQLRAAVAARKGALKALRGRIAEILEPIPVGVVLADEAGEVCKIAHICTGASQWANQSWDVTIKGVGAIADGKLLAEIDLPSKYCDGRNMHYRKDEPTCLYPHNCWEGDDNAGLRYVSGSETRALALRLPAAIARYLEQCESERVANNATLAQI